MLRATTILLGCVLLAYFGVAEVSSQRYKPTVYRIALAKPLPRIYRARRDANDEPLWLYKGDDVNRAPSTAEHPYLPTYIDDVNLDPNRRYARRVDFPSARRHGGSHSTSSGSRGTGPTHPGYNRRDARSIRIPSPYDPQPSPTFPKPVNPFFPGTRGPGPKPIYPIYARHARDTQLSSVFKRPTHFNIPITGINPNARVQPWQKIRVRNGRDVHDHVDVENVNFEDEDVNLDPNRRYARSVDSPSARRHGGSHSTSSGSRGTGPTHPGYNRRNARSIRIPSPYDRRPSPTFPKPDPIYVRHARDTQLSSVFKRPTHFNIPITGINPNARVQPWQKIRVRNGRDVHDHVDVENVNFEDEDEEDIAHLA